MKPGMKGCMPAAMAKGAQATGKMVMSAVWDTKAKRTTVMTRTQTTIMMNTLENTGSR